MQENLAMSVEEQNPSSEQINDAEILVEESLEPIAESDLPPEIATEKISSELEEATVVDTTELTSELSSNVDSEAVPEPILQESGVDAAQTISSIREEAIASFGTGSAPDLNLDVDSLSGIDGSAALSLAPPVESAFSRGTSGNDFLLGTPGNDFLFSAEGDDTVIGLPGRDFVFGEAGNDFLIGGAGNDVVDGGLGDDLIFGDDSRTAADGGGADVIRGGDGLDVVFAGGNNDTVFGDNNDDVIYGESGNDRLNGGDGSDLLDGGDGNDGLFGDSGNDLLNGGNGDDSINAEDGDDVVIGGSGNDGIFGGRGNDTIAGVDIASDTPGFDEIDTLQGGEGSDLFELGDADDFYYDDGQILSPGNIPIGLGDYGLIEDFAIADDLIQLNGSAEQYFLESTQNDSPFNENNLPVGTAIYRFTPGDDAPFPQPILEESVSLDDLTDESSIVGEPIPIEPDAEFELVGVIENVDPSGLSLSDSSQFTFV